MENTTSGHSVEEAADKMLGLLDSEEDNPSEPSEEEAAESEDEAEDESEDESEGSEEEDSDEGESEEEPDEDDETPDPLDDSVEVDVDGERVTLAELKKDRLRQADYTRKTMALADERKAIQAEAEQTRAARDQYADGLRQLQEVVTQLRLKEPDWDTLRKENPAEFAAQWAEHQRTEKAEALIVAERQRIEQEQAGEQQEQVKSYLAAEQERLLEAVPDWKDESKAKAEKMALVEAGEREYGFTPDEFGQVTDHRLVLMLRDALKYRELNARGSEVIRSKKTAAKVLKPGQPNRAVRPGAKKVVRELQQKARRTGRVDDAAAALLATFGDDL